MNKKAALILVQIFIYFSFLSLLIIQLSSCNHSNQKTLTQSNHEVNDVKQWISSQWPKNTQKHKTTSSAIYLANLNSSIQVFKNLYDKTQSAQYGTQLASKLYFRFRILGDFKDATDALKLIQHVSGNNKSDANTYLTLATIQSGFHQFDSALESLKMAKKLGLNYAKIKTLEDEIHYSLGHYQSYKSVINNPKISSLTKAKYALVNNHFKQASLYYKQSMDTFSDTDPFKLSWLQLQQGIAFLRYSDLSSAKVFFSRAHDRFPEYYVVTEHLAETEYLLGNYKAAKLLYQQVIKQINNPEFYAQLAKVESHIGHPSSAQKSLKQAQLRFDQLTRTYPKATGDHAVQFYIDNKQQQKALNLAQINLENRQNIESYELLIKSAVANDNIKLACQTLIEADKLKVAPLEFYQLSSELSCSNSPTTTH